MRPVELLIVGASSRGTVYAEFALEYPELARAVGVAEPREFFRAQLAAKHALAPENMVRDWRQLLERPKFAQAVIIATPDALHLEPAVAFAQRGYNMLLEKPLAPDPESCQRIVNAALAHNIIFAVAHVMRYTSYTQQLKHLIISGVIGELVSIQHLEPVGYWHLWFGHNTTRFPKQLPDCSVGPRQANPGGLQSWITRQIIEQGSGTWRASQMLRWRQTHLHDAGFDARVPAEVGRMMGSRARA